MAQDLTEAVVARLDDDEIRARACTGDLSDFDDLALDDGQRAALVQLAESFDDVTGLAISAFQLSLINLLPSKGLSTANQVSEVHVRGYDPMNKKEIVGKPAPNYSGLGD